MYTVAIQGDQLRLPDGRSESHSARWSERARQHGLNVREVNVWKNDILEQLQGCDAFMWRYFHVPRDRRLAQRLMPVVEHQLGIPIYPDWRTAWHYDDKVAQKYLLEAAGIPAPQTWVFWNMESAREFLATAEYPLVWKLSGGASSESVELLRSQPQAEEALERMFHEGIVLPRVMWWPPARWTGRQRVKQTMRALLLGRTNRPHKSPTAVELHNNYLYLQEFVADNDGDLRVTVVGRRAFAFRRFNRPDDFRASGSGDFDLDPAAVDVDAVRLGFRVAQLLGTQSVAIDFLRRDSSYVVGEVSYAYVTWVVHECPGHWVLGEDGELFWVDGQMWPEDAQFDDFALRLSSRNAAVNQSELVRAQ
jgi:glutathione synthase/RimK-type ligase-like ATP-grasp enzyme